MVCLRQHGLAPPSEVRIPASKYDGGGVLGRVQRGVVLQELPNAVVHSEERRANEARMTSLDFELASTHATPEGNSSQLKEQ